MYWVFRAAKWMHVPPWELAEKNVSWREYALEYEYWENWARAELHKRANSKS